MSNTTPNIDTLQLSDSEFDIDVDLDAPSPTATQQHIPTDLPDPRTSRYTTEEARDAQLKRELENVRSVNKAIEGVIESLEKAKTNMNTVSRTVSSSATLLQTWTRILSQTEHNQRLILSPHWAGSTADVQAAEAEAIERQAAEQRRQREEVLRKEAAARKAEEDARKRDAAQMAATKTPSRRGRGVGGSVMGRGGTRGSYSTSGSNVRGTARPGSGLGRAGTSSSGIGRGSRGAKRGAT